MMTPFAFSTNIPTLPLDGLSQALASVEGCEPARGIEVSAGRHVAAGGSEACG
jgi:hypothetical protein